MPHTHLSPNPSGTVLDRLRPADVRPGAWTDRAQRALDQLSTMASPDEVIATFGTARALCTEVLGRPEAGGHANRPVVRAVGRLLQHRLGPCVAAEVLSWLASVADVVDTPTVERVLAALPQPARAHRPRRLADRDELCELLRAVPRRAERAELLLSWIDSSQRRVTDIWNERWDECLGWFEPWIIDSFEFGRPDGSEDWLGRSTIVPATDPALFEADDDLIAASLRDDPQHVLDNPACPERLRSMVRHPYDLATLELALCAAPHQVDAARMARMLAEAAPQVLSDLADRHPVRVCELLRGHGRLDPTMLIDGPLRAVDITDGSFIDRVLQIEPTPSTTEPDLGAGLLVVLLRRHPRREALAAVATRALHHVCRSSSDLPAEVARILATAEVPDLTRAAYAHVGTELLEPHDAPAARLLGGRVAVSTPGIPAAERPERPAQHARSLSPERRIGRFQYAPEIERLDGTDVPGWPGWRIRLFRTPAELESNARAMRNCTAGFVDALAGEREVVLALRHADGTVLNASLLRSGRRWMADEVNSVANSGNPCSGIGAALAAAANAPAATTAADAWEHLDTARAPRTPRRDRRRNRATAARRRRR